MVAQALQVGGAVMILTGFGLAQTGVLNQHSQVYLWLNLVGAGILAVLAFLGQQWGFLLLEGTWSVISFTGLVARARARARSGRRVEVRAGRS